jgi:hypothetical protein
MSGRFKENSYYDSLAHMLAGSTALVIHDSRRLILKVRSDVTKRNFLVITCPPQQMQSFFGYYDN